MNVDEREKLRDWLIIIAISIGLIIGLICVFNAVRTWRTQRTMEPIMEAQRSIDKTLSEIPRWEPPSSFEVEALTERIEMDVELFSEAYKNKQIKEEK